MQKLIAMHRDVTPVPLIGMLNRFQQADTATPQRLLAPGNESLEREA